MNSAIQSRKYDIAQYVLKKYILEMTSKDLIPIVD